MDLFVFVANEINGDYCDEQPKNKKIKNTQRKRKTNKMKSGKQHQQQMKTERKTIIT